MGVPFPIFTAFIFPSSDERGKPIPLLVNSELLKKDGLEPGPSVPVAGGLNSQPQCLPNSAILSVMLNVEAVPMYF